MLKKSSI